MAGDTGSVALRLQSRAVGSAVVPIPAIDATRVLTGYVLLVMFIPARLVIQALGAAGTPANVYALVAILWLGATWLFGTLAPAPNTGTPRILVGFFATAILLSYLAVGQRSASLLETQAADRGLIQLASWACVVFLASAGIGDPARLAKLLRVLVVCASVIAAIGILEFILGRDLLGWVQIPGLHQNAVAVLTSRGRFARVSATATHPLEFCSVLIMLLPFALQQAFDPARQGKLRRWLPVALLAGAAPMSVSRTSILGLGVALAVLLPTWGRKRRWAGVVAIIVGLAGLRAVAPGLIGTLTKLVLTLVNGGDDSTQARTMDYAGVADFIARRPAFGMGYGTFLPQLYRYTDNMYLLAVVEIGFVGVLAMAALFLGCMYCGAAGRRRSTDEPTRDLGQAFVAAGAVALVTSATFDTLSFPMFSGVFFLLLGCAGAYLGMARRNRDQIVKVIG
ncbi:MAG: hypothetical protein AUG44_29105 [Actinobacteria bacterium 13_1_20CM_3_71_11]|nr:MAG: hypothetical protein AUG44_29105 [Actinobacteria bacterium 13_1_20CM_3_71_11]